MGQPKYSDFPLGFFVLLGILAMGIVGWGFYLYYDKRRFSGALIFMLAIGLWASFVSTIAFGDPLFLRPFYSVLSGHGEKAYRCQ